MQSMMDFMKVEKEWNINKSQKYSNHYRYLPQSPIYYKSFTEKR